MQIFKYNFHNRLNFEIFAQDQYFGPEIEWDLENIEI